MRCSHCGNELQLDFLDLGGAPPSNAYLSLEDLSRAERHFPLRVAVCTGCWLVQTRYLAEAGELFTPDYAYFSSFSTSWLAHAQRYVARMADRLGLGPGSLVAEIAANDGYLLQYVAERGIPCYGVEPTRGTAAAARAKGIEIVEEFFGARLAGELAAAGKQADLLVANNVLAHVPDLNDFVSGFALLLKPGGTATFEFPHLLRLVEGNQFDTVYHEHFSYLSLTAVSRIFRENGLAVYHVEELSSHGGSLRVYARRADCGGADPSPEVLELLERERAAGMLTPSFYAGFQGRAERVKDDLLGFLLEAKRAGKVVLAYGAAAKGNTLLNYAGVRPDLLPLVVDRNPAKQGHYLPGSRIPIVDESCLSVRRPDYVLILPWNLRDEVTAQLDFIRQWGGRFVTAVPSLAVY